MRKMDPELRADGGPGAPKDSDPLVGLDDDQKFVHFVSRREFLKAKGNGFDGHVVTIGHALLELHRMGHKGSWLRQGGAGLLAEVGPGHARVTSLGEGKVGVSRFERPTPLTREYWAAQAKDDLGEIVSSHRVKYPYSFYALAKDVKDEDLKKRILAKVYRLTATN